MSPTRHRLSGIMRVRSCIVALLLIVSWLTSASAHRLDEYLQATLVDIAPDSVRLRINLTPGTAVADTVLGSVDTDHDGAISEVELRAYAESLKRDLDVRLDGRLVALELVRSTADDLSELKDGLGIIKVEFSATLGMLSGGNHEITFQNRHLPAISTYLVNATKPLTDQIEITAQKRSPSQNVSKIAFQFHAATVHVQTHPNTNLPTAILAVWVIVALFVILWRLTSAPVVELRRGKV